MPPHAPCVFQLSTLYWEPKKVTLKTRRVSPCFKETSTHQTPMSQPSTVISRHVRIRSDSGRMLWRFQAQEVWFAPVWHLHDTREASSIWVFPKIGKPQNGWFIMENPINKWMISGYHCFSKHPFTSSWRLQSSQTRPLQHCLKSNRAANQLKKHATVWLHSTESKTLESWFGNPNCCAKDHLVWKKSWEKSWLQKKTSILGGFESSHYIVWW